MLANLLFFVLVLAESASRADGLTCECVPATGTLSYMRDGAKLQRTLDPHVGFLFNGIARNVSIDTMSPCSSDNTCEAPSNRFNDTGLCYELSIGFNPGPPGNVKHSQSVKGCISLVQYDDRTNGPFGWVVKDMSAQRTVTDKLGTQSLDSFAVCTTERCNNFWPTVNAGPETAPILPE